MTAPVHRRRPKPSVALFAHLVRGVGALLLALGVFAAVMGARTLRWPRAQAVILAARVDVRPSTYTVPGTDKYRGGRTETRDTASFYVRYRFEAGARAYEGSGVEPYDFGLRNSALSRALGTRYPPGRRVEVAYDPDNPAVSYLEPGPSTTAWMFSAVGTGLLLVGGLIGRTRRR